MHIHLHTRLKLTLMRQLLPQPNRCWSISARICISRKCTAHQVQQKQTAYRFHNYTVTLQTLMVKYKRSHYDTVSDTTGAQSIDLLLTIVGQYNITFSYGGQTLNVRRTLTNQLAQQTVGDIYLPSTATTTLTVQQDPISTSLTAILFQLNTGLAQFTVKTPTGGRFHQTG